ncbi:MAG: S1C family serine protease [Patescibacteria group bacterium]
MKSFYFYRSDLKFRFLKKPIFWIIIVSFIFGLLGGLIPSVYFGQLLYKELSKEKQVQLPETIPQVVKEASPAVVSIIISKYVPVYEQGYYNPFGENSPFDIRIPIIQEKGKELREVGAGTGFIVSSNGLIATNKHVVLDDEAEYTVLTNDGNRYKATILARDPVQDIGIVKIEASNLPVVKLGDSDNLEIGQTVIAIGNALGQFRNTVSSGIISGLLRTITASGGGISEQLEDIIQTDAAINPGNSGGPLLNLYGEVIGMNTAVATEAENIGFAIPINKVKRDIADIETKGRIIYAFLGVRYILVNKAIAESNKLPVDYGALISRGDNPDEPAIVPDSAADKAGIKEGDIILELNGTRINENNTLAKLISKHRPGDKVNLKILRDDKEIVVKAVLGEMR